MRTVQVGDTSSKVYFTVYLLDAVTKALGEVGGQPQLMVNGGEFSSNGIGPLVTAGYGRYYAILNLNQVSIVPGDVLLTRYKSAITADTEGDSFLVVTANNAIPTQNTNVDHYGTIQGGDFYFNNRLGSNRWLNASRGDKRKSLIMATQMIDRLNFIYEKTDPLQALQFPRTVVPEHFARTTLASSIPITLIPDDIITACYIIALKLLSGVNTDNETNSLAISMSKFQVAQTFYERSFLLEHQRAGIPSSEAWLLLRPYVSSTAGVTLTKV